MYPINLQFHWGLKTPCSICQNANKQTSKQNYKGIYLVWFLGTQWKDDCVWKMLLGTSLRKSKGETTIEGHS